MGYYRGDYYRGDYYRGDLGGFFKKAAGVVTGAVKGFITGGPVGALAGAGGALVKKLPAAQSNASLVPAIGTMGVGGVIGTAVRVGSKVIPPLLAGKEVIDMFGVKLPFGRNGKKRRTMNHLNPRALARSTRRIEGFVKKARKIASPLGYTLQRRSSSRCAPRARRKCS